MPSLCSMALRTGPVQPASLGMSPCPACRKPCPGRQQRLVHGATPEDNKDLDLVERLFGRLFGKRALDAESPLGMKRMTPETFPEQFPATTTEFAAPVAGDGERVAWFRPLLAQTRLEGVPLRLAYSAHQHGWTAAAFHEQVDTFGAGVVLAQTEGGAWFGGYNNRGWIGLGEDRTSIAAFLFTWPDGNTSQNATKLPKVGGSSLAVQDKADSGPWFGAEDLQIRLQADSPRRARSRCGSYYARMPDGRRSLFAEAEKSSAQLVDLECYVAEGSREEWELKGVVWSTKQS